MDRTEVLKTVLQISCEDEYITQLGDELTTYFSLLTGVIVESSELLSPYTLGNSRGYANNFCSFG